jgi:hypothetical protein
MRGVQQRLVSYGNASWGRMSQPWGLNELIQQTYLSKQSASDGRESISRVMAVLVRMENSGNCK